MGGTVNTRRKAIRALGAGAAALVAAAATLDLWLPPLAERFAGELTYAERSTRPGRTVTWREAEWRDGGVVVKAKEAEVSAPWRILGRGRADARVEGWSVDVAREEDGGRNEAEAFGWPELQAVLAGVGGQLQRRVGEAVLKDGVVRAGGEEIAVAELAVKGGVAAGVVSWRGRVVKFELDLTGGRVRVADAASGAELEARAEAERVEGSVRWAGNESRFEAAGFAAGQWGPAEFLWKGEGWRVPAELLGEGAGTLYEDPRVDFTVRRAGAGVGVEARAEAAPREAGLPPVTLALEGEAGVGRVRVARLELVAPAAKARLSAPVEWTAEGGWDAPEAAEFRAEAELGAWSAGRVEGRVAAAARWSAGRVRWEASLADGAWAGWRGLAAEAAGETNLEETVIEKAAARAEGGARAEFSGRMAHADGGRLEQARLVAEADGAVLEKWIQRGPRVGRVELEATAEGAWAELRAAGTVTVEDAAYGEWRADVVELRAEGRWNEDWRGELAAKRGGARLEVAGEWREAGLKISRARWVRGADGAELASAGEGEAGAGRVKLELAGTDGRVLAVDWTRGGELAARVSGLDSAWLEEWREGAKWPRVAVGELAVKGGPDAAGLVAGEGRADVAWSREDGTELRAKVAGAADADGFLITELEAGLGGQALATGEGRVPWRWRVGATPGWAAVEGGAWSLRLRTRPEAGVWAEAAKAAGLSLERPELELALAGAARAPEGRVNFSAGRIGLSGEGLPEGGLELRALRLETVVTKGAIVVPVLKAEVDGQRVEADGRVELAEGDWARLKARPFVWLLANAEGRLSLPEARVEALARYLPRLLAPTGVLEAELRLSRGTRLDGKVVLRDGGTRPLGDFGVLHDLDLDLALAGLEMRVERATARAGGQEVAITGVARRVPGERAALDLTLKAERFPLVRKPGLILRADLDLTVKTNEETGRTRLGGAVALRDSLVLADIRPLLAAGGGPASAAKARPPYFSVDTAPLGDWELGVTVRGDRFVRIRTPVFEGRGSAAFTLEGTLREPRAWGEFTVEPGRILFPFASFTVQEGAVRIARNDPYTARLDFRAAGRRLGYDLRLELDGTVEAPQMRLFSTPALEAEEVLLMVTAGLAPTEELTAGTGQRLAAVGAYVGRDLLRTFGMAGSDEDRLTIRSGDQVSRAGRETYGFEFTLTDRWSLVGDYDEFDAYNMGARWRFRAKEPETAGAAGEEETP